MRANLFHRTTHLHLVTGLGWLELDNEYRVTMKNGHVYTGRLSDVTYLRGPAHRPGHLPGEVMTNLVLDGVRVLNTSVIARVDREGGK